MGTVAKYLGDSEHGTADINPLGLAVGVTLGLLLGALPILVPGLGTMALGSAAGPLIVGLVLGRVQRSGPIVWTLPHQAAEVLTQLGLLLFLAYAGGRAGSAFITALQTPVGYKIILAGIVVSGVHAIALLAIARKALGTGGPRLAGYIAGSQTQPAILAFANSSTRFDERVALGYALVYPVAMVTKIVVTQVLTIVG
jgi:putative transport protein